MNMLAPEPGGYLQWVDPDNRTVRTDKSRPENKSENLAALMSLVKSQDPRLNPTWVHELPDIFSGSGLVDV